jgi:PhzF family phenazine biosynthesis protein
MPYPLYVVDAFTSHRFGGNPAAVCIIDEEKNSDWMQSVAAEMNLSETAFVRPKLDIFELKWFTPKAEVALCGHATLAAAHILWESKVVPVNVPVNFNTLSGKLTATKSAAWINLDFPALGVEKTILAPDPIVDALGVDPVFVGKSRFDYLVEVATEAEVFAAKPNFTALAKETSIRGSILTARSNSVEYDFVSRFFLPGDGIDEDPVTGSAHCSLVPYWSAKIKRNELTGYQASKRGGIIRAVNRGSRVNLSGQAVTVTKGTLL